MISQTDETLAFGPIATLRRALCDGLFSPVELVELVLARIDRDEPRLKAWVEIDRDAALGAARTADLSAPLGGIPFGVKDVIDVRNMPTRFGANISAPLPQLDAWCVAAVRRAGAIPLGKLHTTPFAYADPAPTKNAIESTYSPGGSSSGSGAAVGAHQIPFAFGTQTGGSTLRPAAFNGVAGFKPTFSAIPTTGVAMLAPTFDTVGIIARTASDLAEVFAVYYPGALDAVPPPAPRIIDALGYRMDISGSQVCAAIDRALEALVAAGATRTKRALPSVVEQVESNWRAIAAYEASAVLPPLIERVSGYPRAEKLIAEGLAQDAACYRKARDVRSQIVGELSALLSEGDVIALPSAGEVPKFGSMGDAHFLRLWSLGGFPSISIPVGFDATGLPIGMQLVAKRGDDLMLLAIARWAENQLT
ncbi:MAG TPA: amidase [Candidatus Baltobacteraceae bacterium]